MANEGPTLLLTRPAPQSRAFAQDLAERLGRMPPVVISPVFGIVYRQDVPDPSGYAGVVLTSAHGAQALAGARNVGGLWAHCVGDRTAEVARGLGMNATSAGGNADDLVAQLAGRPGPLLHLRGAESRGDVAARLTAGGTPTDEAVVYDQAPCPPTPEALALLQGAGPVVAPLFSPRSALLLARIAEGARAPLRLVAISSAAARSWGTAPSERLTVAERPDAEAMLACVAGHFRGNAP